MRMDTVEGEVRPFHIIQFSWHQNPCSPRSASCSSDDSTGSQNQKHMHERNCVGSMNPRSYTVREGPTRRDN